MDFDDYCPELSFEDECDETSNTYFLDSLTEVELKQFKQVKELKKVFKKFNGDEPDDKDYLGYVLKFWSFNGYLP